MQLLTVIYTAFQRWAVYNRTYEELAMFSERQLADIGIQRSDIGNIAHDAAESLYPPVIAKKRKAFTKVATAN